MNLNRQHAFILAVAVACFIHGTWTVATITGGAQPPPVVDLGSLLRWAFWVVPGALVSFALDIGQYRTAVEISTAHAEGRRAWGKYATFVVISIFVYYLQWYHLVHHLPELTLSAAIEGGIHAATVKSLAGFMVWIYPALLPITTLLYTLSSHAPAAPAAAPEQPTLTHLPQVEAAPEVAAPLPPLAALADRTGSAPALTAGRDSVEDEPTAAIAARPANRRRTARKVDSET
jgi:hypothetical protein